MNEAFLELLRCPFCGTRLTLVNNTALARQGPNIDSGVLGCECCAFPIVAGIPVLLADDSTRAALRALEAGARDEALRALLGVEGERTARFAALQRQGTAATYRDAIEVLSPNAEGTYFLYRFSDPTFVTAEAVIRALGQADGVATGPRLDLCGGSGHLTRILATLPPATNPPPTVIADLYFWKLWLATRFTAPGVTAVCCDASAPLPFVRDAFALVVLMDAFPYVWHRRLCAEEMMRVTRPDGIVALPHLHSALGDNFAAGDALSPSAYRDLFEPYRPRLFNDAHLLDAIVEHQLVDLSAAHTPETLGTQPSLTLVAGGPDTLWRRHPIPSPPELVGELTVNPLYAVERRAGRSVLTLTFPTPEYETEFGACRRYLPARLTLSADVTGALEPAMFGPRYLELRQRRVLLDTPGRYCRASAPPFR